MAGTNNTLLKELEVAYSLGKPCLKDGDPEQNQAQVTSLHTLL